MLLFTAKVVSVIYGRFNSPVENAKIEIVSQTKDRLHIKITDQDKKRYEVPIPLKEETIEYEEANYVVELNEKPFSFKVVCQLTNRV